MTKEKKNKHQTEKKSIQKQKDVFQVPYEVSQERNDSNYQANDAINPFIQDLGIEISKMEEIPKGYDLLMKAFETAVNDFKQDVSKSTERNDQTNESPSYKNTNENNKFEQYAKKFKTPRETKSVSVLNLKKQVTSNFQIFSPKTRLDFIDEKSEATGSNQQNRPATRRSTLIASNNNESLILNDSNSLEKKIPKSKKRSAQIAEISLTDHLISDEDIANDKKEEQNEKKTSSKNSKLTKASSKSKKKKLKNKHKSSSEQEEHEVIDFESNSQEQEQEEQMESTKSKSSKNPSKKPKLSRTESANMNNKELELNKTLRDEEQPDNVKTKKSKSKEAKTNKDKKEKKQKKSCINKESEVESVDSPIKVEKSLTNMNKLTSKITLKTPHVNRLSRKLLQSTIKRSIAKVMPLTRRAAAARAAAAAVSSDHQTTKPSTSKSSDLPPEPMSVKKIVQNIESKIKLIPTPAKLNRTINNNIQPSAVKNKNLNSVIDSRKQRLSKCKQTEKRKSEAKMKLVYKEICENKAKIIESSKANRHILEESSAPVIEKESSKSNDDSQRNLTPSSNRYQIKINGDVILTNPKSAQEELLINDIIKSNTPKCLVSKIPESLIKNNAGLDKSISAKQLTAIINHQQQQKCYIELSQSQYKQRMLAPQAISTSSIRTFTPLKSSATYQSLTNLNNNRQSNYVKQTERTTPSKLMRTEIDERKKQELQAKEAKEKERLENLQKQKQEKTDTSKKQREEKLKKLAEFKEKQKEETEAKLKEMEKKRQEEIEKKKEKEKANNQSVLNSCQSNTTQQIKNTTMASAQKKPYVALTSLSKTDLASLQQKQINQKGSEILASIKSSKMAQQQFEQNMQTIAEMKKKSNIPAITIDLSDDDENVRQPLSKKNQNLEITYVLDSPKKSNNKTATANSNLKSTFSTISSYDVTPLQPLKLKDNDNYDVSGLKSEDETDDEEDPKKPLPQWARESYLNPKAQAQSLNTIDFTKLFRAASRNEIILEDIFRTKRKKFTERSSSANWSSPPVWNTGLNGEESFRQFKKNF